MLQRQNKERITYYEESMDVKFRTLTKGPRMVKAGVENG